MKFYVGVFYEIYPHTSSLTKMGQQYRRLFGMTANLETLHHAPVRSQAKGPSSLH
jgi:hypothetical protein